MYGTTYNVIKFISDYGVSIIFALYVICYVLHLPVLRLIKIAWTMVVATKWSENGPSTPTIQVGILLPSVSNSLQKGTQTKKRPGLSH